MPVRNLLGRWRLDWPLLGKELLEQASRKQLYVLRVTYALLLFGGFCFYYIRHLSAGPMLALGRGLGPFRFLVMAQLAAIYVLLPPLMAGALAREKERDTLGLLFLTDLTPWELVLQKYVGRLIPMLTLQLLSLPLLAVTYSLGGVSAPALCFSAAMLFLTCLAVGALALECSAHEATTFQALVRCWGLCIVFAACCSFMPTPFWLLARTVFAPVQLGPYRVALAFPLLFATASYLTPTAFFLIRAKQILETRAFVARRNPFGYQFKQLDQYWRDLRKLVRAISQTRDREAYTIAEQVVRRHLGVAENQPIFSLTHFLFARMQVPSLLAFSIITGFIALIFLTFSALFDPGAAGVSIVVGALWVLALLTIPIQSANVIARERINQRLDPILTTPLTSREILGEWLDPLRRWIRFLSRPLLVVFVVGALVKYHNHARAGGRWMHVGLYLCISLLTLWIYPRLAQWSCLWIGLRIRHQVRALMASFLIVVAWCAVPEPACNYLDETGLVPAEWSQALKFVSPVTVIRLAETLGRPRSFAGTVEENVIFAAVHLALAVVLLWRLRQLCLRNADRYLGRL